MPSTAPVCPISRDQPVPGQFAPIVPIVPLAYDLPSAIRALNQINAILNNPTTPLNNLPGGHIPIASGGPGVATPGATKLHWTEESRETERVDICDPDGDPETDFVTVTRITRVVFASPGSLIKLVWNLRP